MISSVKLILWHLRKRLRSSLDRLAYIRAPNMLPPRSGGAFGFSIILASIDISHLSLTFIISIKCLVFVKKILQIILSKTRNPLATYYESSILDHFQHNVKTYVFSLFCTPDLPFRKDDTQRIIPYVVALMVYLASIFLIAGVHINAGLTGWSASHKSTLSVKIKVANKEYEKTLDRTKNILKEVEEIKELRIISKNRMQQVLKKWTGTNIHYVQLDLPIWIDVEFRRNKNITADVLQNMLEKELENVKVYDQSKWLGGSVHFMWNIKMFAFLMVLMILLVTIAVTGLAARIGLKLHQNIIDLLHSIGAEDDYIAKQFASNTFLITLRGTFIGVVFAWLTILLTRDLITNIDSRFLEYLHNDNINLLLLGVVMLITIVSSVFSVKVTVMRTLSKMP